MIPEFNAVGTELESGFTVIEASAGTGKTTTISAIVLRLLVEKGIPLERILVATYTELATAELRGRIRDVVRQALRFLRGGEATLPFVREIMAKARSGTEEKLQAALRSFDEAAIFTIHGFCARVLADRAFESGSLFDLELTTEQSVLLHEVVDDFWRANFYGDDVLVAQLLGQRLKPEHLRKLLVELTSNPALRLEPESPPSASLKVRLADAWAREGECDALNQMADQLVLALQGEFCAWARRDLARRKADRRLLSFDDMLTRVDAALRGERGANLREALRARFPVALIDEFQDTDPIQYSILRQIYGGTSASVFFIGDPKQAIYGFRGADVFTYLAAAKDARRYTLATNWRSDAKLVEGVSAIFSRKENAFVIPGIDLPPVKAARVDQSHEPRLRIWRTNEKREIGARAVASEIARLLREKTMAPRDIAILVNNNTQPTELQAPLAALGIPSVVYSAANVFKSGEAEDLRRILLAVAQPSREQQVRAALATEFLGFSASGLDELTEASLEEILNRFAQYHSLWRDDGFVEMTRALLMQEKVRTRLLTLRNGERRLTNLLHLIELVHLACAENQLGLDGAINWLERQQKGEVREESELRLESDEDAVRIVTIHKSKGLEYDVTFYPYARKEPWRGGNEFLKFHEGSDLVLDLAKTAEHKKIRGGEELAESVRHLYVALTRAKHRSYVVWQEDKRKSKAGLTWLFAREDSAEKFAAAGSANTAGDAAAYFSESETVSVEGLPDREGQPIARPLVARKGFDARVFSGEIDRSWDTVSFSSLAKGRLVEPETPDYDSTETALEIEPLLPAQGIHAFPGGTRAGTCLHKILEELDFSDPTQIAPLVKRKLKNFRISGFDEVIVEMLTRLLHTSLPLADFPLGEITQRLPELEFTFPINEVTAPKLQALFDHTNGEIPAVIGRLQFQPTRGFLKGFIDVVFEHRGKFYFVDWKSNWLGPDATFYRSENLAQAMAKNFYTLQLSIYTVALHRFLQQRLPGYDYEKNFGGAFYIFLRGLESGGGVFSARPPLKFVEQLEEIFGHGTN